MSASTPERRDVLKYAEGLEREADRKQAEVVALRQRVTWLCQDRAPEDWCNLLLADQACRQRGSGRAQGRAQRIGGTGGVSAGGVGENPHIRGCTSHR